MRDVILYGPFCPIHRKRDAAGLYETFLKRAGGKCRYSCISCGHSISVSVRKAALDFGGRVGRLSQPLANYFDVVVGVDISPEMIRLADEINQHPARVWYVCNDREDLAVLPTSAFTFMYSNVVLQHIEPATTLR